MELFIPTLEQRGIKCIVSECEIDEGEVPGGCITILTGLEDNDHPIMIDYEYTDDEWYGVVIYADDLAPWDLAYQYTDGDGWEDVPTMEEAVDTTNEYQAGALDIVGSIRHEDAIESERTVIFRGVVPVQALDDDSQNLVEEWLINKAKEWASSN